jgi:hypothetical protein
MMSTLHSNPTLLTASNAAEPGSLGECLAFLVGTNATEEVATRHTL